MTPLEKARFLQAETIIKNLEKRNMTGIYCESREACLKTVLELIGDGKTVSWGGSESMKQCGIAEALKAKGTCTVLDRTEYAPEDMKDFYTKTFNADYFIMGTNAITLDGELVNIDGNGNRLSSLIFGPEHVIVIAGINKVASDLKDAFWRVRNIASPPNTIRLQKNTPCTKDGRCHDCFSPDCICNQIVVTRRSREKERIIVLLVNDSLGF
ncbi:MAG: lactate utilization protein [Acutalibacteraceae bacterium]